MIEAAPEFKAAKATSLRHPRQWLNDLELDLANNYIVKRLIGTKSLTVVYGPSGDGKTFFTGDLVCHVACGLSWRGRRVRQGLAVYVAAEAGTSILQRFFAWRERHATGRDGIPLAVITKGTNLLNLIDVNSLILELQSISAEAEMPISIVVFDTLSRSMPGGDENAAMDMTRVISAADLIRDELGASSLIVHHTGKDSAKGPRGSNALFAAADTVISVVERVATLEKSRDGIAGEQFPFDLEVVELGQDQDGDVVTTCVVKPADGVKTKPKPLKLTPSEQIAVDALQDELAESGRLLPGTSVIPSGVAGVRIEAWRSRFYSRLGEAKEPDAKRQAWNRAKTSLIGRKVANAWEEWAWMA